MVCLTLAARYRALPVLAGAVLAFALLNLGAVLFGSALAKWLPPQWVTLAVGILFLAFGLHAIRSGNVDEEPLETETRSGRSLLLSTLLLIGLAEFGDKTQIAVAGLASTSDPTAVWLGATLALAMTSAIGVWAGRTLLQHIPIPLMHRISGILFLAMGGFSLASLLM
ncbi:TMEM165/GDT1 family protein [Thiolapillus sp.]|uniref:TMEM165/GDT1 family protein n=2 Tax=Thiolapillus sp. TaxID=2017437 RepID=UPI0025CBFCF6|nr:TMEM165/GDT1 family protein [Thiolapillus sp.]